MKELFKSELIKVLLIGVFVIVCTVGLYNTIANYSAIASNFSISGLITSLDSNKVRIRFDADGGTVDSIDKVVTVGEKVGDLPTPTKEGYIFSHWYRDTEDNKVNKNTILNDNSKVLLKAYYYNLDDIAILAKQTSNNWKNMTSFVPYEGDALTLAEVQAKPNATRIDNGATDNHIYMWSDRTASKDYVYWTDADVTLLPKDSSKLFSFDNGTITKIDLSHFNSSFVNDMSDMFYRDVGLTYLDISSFDTSNVTSMSNMFNYCCNLTSLIVNFSFWNTENVRDMSGMFYYMLINNNQLNEISSFNVSNVINMSEIFCNVRTNNEYLTANLSNWDTSNVTDMSFMFGTTSSVVSSFSCIDVSSFNTSRVTNMSGMFKNCGFLESLDISHFDTTEVLNMSSMFNNCNNLVQLDMSNFNTLSVTSFDDVFYNVRKLVVILSCDNASNLKEFINTKYTGIVVTCA